MLKKLRFDELLPPLLIIVLYPYLSAYVGLVPLTAHSLMPKMARQRQTKSVKFILFSKSLK
jgi:hypothetical protein